MNIYQENQQASILLQDKQNNNNVYDQDKFINKFRENKL